MMQKENRIDKLERSVIDGSWKSNRREYFGGAGIYILPCLPEGPEHAVTYVISPFAYELSALVFELADIYRGTYDWLSKYGFFGKIAESMNRSIEAGAEPKEIAVNAVEAIRETVDVGNTKLYFAYGSNMDIKQMARRCPEAYLIGTAALHGSRFNLDEVGVATIVPGREDDLTYGLLWRITECDEENLDCYEGVDAGCYEKINVEVAVPWGKATALAYRSLREPDNGSRRGGYMERIIGAAEVAGFPEEYVQRLRKL